MLYLEDGFVGYPYVMAMTPYPFGEDRFENPCIRVSHDGIAWTSLPGAPDPVVQPLTDTDWHWSDPDLAFVDGTLHLVLRGCTRGNPEAELFVTTTRDGVVWTPLRRFHSGRHVVSPSMACRSGHWFMWHVEAGSRAGEMSSRLVRSLGADIEELRDATECTLDLPGHVLWHIDVIPTEEGWEALCAAYPNGTDASRCALFHAMSDDGITFTATDPRPVLAPRPFSWCSRAIYRSTMIKTGPTTYRVWYAGCSWAQRWQIGLAEGPIHRLSSVPGHPGGRTGDTILEAVRARTGYLAMHHTPPALKRVARRVMGSVRRTQPHRRQVSGRG
ncbi:MAG: hypothetical protein L0H79_15650 [Intrasporangium sp.]|uniref:hypothetical protein n=1 Tax=Intrasporangium sp. TaxID=1925024 RepID=UPI00264954DE|nr:hypothetical protein [Intrasporangium sp.]MDN5797170.1 hypothetical protein [Intrasporangium sp.]